MYAILRQYSYDPERLAGGRQALADVRRLHASQPGYAGSLVIDDGQRLIAVNLWDDQQAASAGRTAIGPQVQRLLEPLMTGATELIAVGEVITNDRNEQS